MSRPHTLPNIRSSFTLPCGVIIGNRLVKTAMTERIADNHNAPTAEHEALYRKWSRNGAGILITGNVMTDRVHLESSGNVCFDSEDMIPKLKRWANAATENGNHCWVQISHAGRQTSRFVTSHPHAPSPIQLKRLGLFGKPVAMTGQDITELIDGFAMAASIAKRSGFTGVQVHAAHGYLLSQFLSPRINRRQDEWGGSLENRCRLLLTIIGRIRDEVGESFPISVKINSSDFDTGGFTEDESMKVIRKLEEAGIDLLEISGGTYERSEFLLRNAKDSTMRREAYFIKFANKIRAMTTTPLMVTGGFRSFAFCEEVLEQGEIDFIGMARPFLTNAESMHAFLQGREEILKDSVIRTGITLFENAAEGGYYARQLIRLAHGKAFDPRLRALSSASFLVLYELIKSLKRKRS